jgi:hypothetical protein
MAVKTFQFPLWDLEEGEEVEGMSLRIMVKMLVPLLCAVIVMDIVDGVPEQTLLFLTSLGDWFR